MIDFHTHILPALDDGSKDREMSLTMLEMERNMGVGGIAFTPHFYARKMNPDTFLQMREESYRQIALNCDLPVVLGAEIAYYFGISHSEEIYKLAYGNSDILLLEMPFAPWSRMEIEEVEGLLYNGFTPVLAHVERFLPFKNLPAIKRLKKAGCLLQMNAEAVIEKDLQKTAFKLVQEGMIDCFASDCHSLGHRKPNLREAWEVLAKNCKEKVLLDIQAREDHLFHHILNS